MHFPDRFCWCPNGWDLPWLADSFSHFANVPNPIGSMYGIYANIWGILMVNVTIYGIHGSYGNWHSPIEGHLQSSQDLARRGSFFSQDPENTTLRVCSFVKWCCWNMAKFGFRLKKLRLPYSRFWYKISFPRKLSRSYKKPFSTSSDTQTWQWKLPPICHLDDCPVNPVRWFSKPSFMRCISIYLPYISHRNG